MNAAIRLEVDNDGVGRVYWIVNGKKYFLMVGNSPNMAYTISLKELFSIISAQKVINKARSPF